MYFLEKFVNFLKIFIENFEIYKEKFESLKIFWYNCFKKINEILNFLLISWLTAGWGVGCS